MAMDKLFIHPCYSFEMENAIRAGFEGDDEIAKYYDPDVTEEITLDLIVRDITNKIKQERVFYLLNTFKVCLNNKVIGFVVLVNEPNSKRLFSFSVAKQYRNRMVLSGLFEWIKNYFNSDFECYLYIKNERAIRWLEKCGMNKSGINNFSIIKLFYHGSRK